MERLERMSKLVKVSILIVLGIAALVAGMIVGKLTDGDSAKAKKEVLEDVPAAPEEEPELPEMAAHAEDDYKIAAAGAAALDDVPAAPIGESSEDVMDGPGYGGTTALADSADVPEDATLDEYGMYRVPFEWASQHGGIFVERNGGLYAISPEVPRYVAEMYDVGYSAGSSNTETMLLYLNDTKELNEELPAKVRKVITSAGDFPILKVNKGEKLHVYNNYMINEIAFVKSEFVGYTIPARDGGSGVHDYFPIIDHVLPNDVNRENMGVLEENGNPVADVHDLEQGKMYIFEWYSGTEYNKMDIRADSKCYSNPKPSGDNRIVVPIELAKADYAVVDTASLEPGFYTIMESTIFEITE